MLGQAGQGKSRWYSSVICTAGEAASEFGSQLEKYAQSHHLYEGFLLLIARSPSASEWGWAENFHGLCWESHREGGGCFSAFGC